MSEPNWSNLHGLIIGINKYKSPNREDLSGCVADATSIADYLVEVLGVPRGQLLCLFDEQATRDGIINAFWTHLIQNKEIKPSDPIVIYFAGHGDSHPAPVGLYSTDGRWEFILPHDASIWNPDGTYNWGIPDRTLGALIYQLSKAKGDNITVILDSCFSGSGTRGQSRSRQSHDPDAPPVPPTLDREILQMPPPTASVHATVTKKSPRKLLAPSLETHVLLAACQNHELAQEVTNTDPITKELLDPPTSGLFTSALLRALRECNAATTSYSELMRIVLNDTARQTSRSSSGLSVQTPQCEGRKKDRLLFRTQFAMSKGMIALLPTRTKSIFRIKAGSASGIQVGTELGVYSGTMSTTSTPLARLVAIEVSPTEAKLGPPMRGSIVEVPPNAYVVVTKYNDQAVRILVNDESKLPELWQEVFENIRSLAVGVILSKPGEASDLVLTPVQGGVTLQRQDPSLIQLEPSDIVLKHNLGAEEITRRLASMAHFHFHLQRRNPDSPLKGLVGMQLIELDCQINSLLGYEEYVPMETRVDLFGDSLMTGAAVTLKASTEKRYGLVITNRSNWPLYAYVLYFDLEDYSIGCLYSPPSRSMDPPLANNGEELGVGYGSSGADPLRVENSGRLGKESGFFVLFVSSTWVDISHLEQESPFEEQPEPEVRGTGPERKVKPDSSAWDIIVVGVSIVE
ncbi:hypothetical protein FRC08_010595 [Ceratobasidium sp. 394]|nr:hypothetical protein FRC08_010595 [Ceratobasidium sp. 394]